MGRTLEGNVFPLQFLTEGKRTSSPILAAMPATNNDADNYIERTNSTDILYTHGKDDTTEYLNTLFRARTFPPLLVA